MSAFESHVNGQVHGQMIKPASWVTWKEKNHKLSVFMTQLLVIFLTQSKSHQNQSVNKSLHGRMNFINWKKNTLIPTTQWSRANLFEFRMKCGVSCRRRFETVFVYMYETQTRRAALRTRIVLRDKYVVLLSIRHSTPRVIGILFTRAKLGRDSDDTRHTYILNELPFRLDFFDNDNLCNILHNKGSGFLLTTELVIISTSFRVIQQMPNKYWTLFYRYQKIGIVAQITQLSIKPVTSIIQRREWGGA